MSKVCKIESEKIVNGTMMFHDSEIETWNSPLDKLENGTYMFALASSLKSFRCYDNDEANGKSYCEMASLSNGNGMFKGTKVSFDGEVLDVPKLQDGASMFEEANIGYGEIGSDSGGRIDLKAPYLNNGYCMFYKAKADALYLELSSVGGGADMRYCFGDTSLVCGAIVKGCERFENVSNMFDFCKCRKFNESDITNPNLSQYEGVDIWLEFGNDSRAYYVCASNMFTGCTTKTFGVTYKRTMYYTYTYTYHKNLTDENFFTHLGNLMDITDADGMFYCFSYEPRYGTASFGIRETETTTKCWDKLEKADYMFANCSIDYLYLANELFRGSADNYGMTASHMFANSIRYYILGADTYGSPIGYGCAKVAYVKGPSLCYCSDASGMFLNCTGIEQFTLKGRDALCGEVGKAWNGNYPKGDNMFSGCTTLKTFRTLKEQDNGLDYGYHKVSSGVDCFKGCVLEGRETLVCVYNFLSACADSTIGISKAYAKTTQGQQDMNYLWGVAYPTLSVAHNGGTLHFEYNTVQYLPPYR